MAASFIDTVARFIERHELLAEGTRVLVGVSGGADSMVCLAVLRELGYEVVAFHANYELRAGAEADQALVERWCAGQSPAVPVHVEVLDAEARAQARGESLQEAARILRYDALAERAEAVEASAVATGHHKNDQAETLLLNLIRGSGVEGLAGMPPSRPLRPERSVRLVRPLLEVTRDQIEAYADAEGVPWRTDPTNRDPSYDRATIRTEILPRLERHFEGVTENLARSAGLVREYVDHTVSPALRERMQMCYCEEGEGGRLALAPLRSEPPVWRRRLILEALRRALPQAPQTFAVAAEIDDLVDAQVGKRVEVGKGAVWRERNGLCFLPSTALPEPEPPTRVPWTEDVSVSQGTLRIEETKDRPDRLETNTPNEVYADADRLSEPLSLRTWAEGDRLQPLGLDGTKRVSELLREEKVPSHQRAGICVLCTADHVAWVVGLRLDHRVRVRPSTERVARLVWRPRENSSDDCISA